MHCCCLFYTNIFVCLNSTKHLFSLCRLPRHHHHRSLFTSFFAMNDDDDVKHAEICFLSNFQEEIPFDCVYIHGFSIFPHASSSSLLPYNSDIFMLFKWIEDYIRFSRSLSLWGFVCRFSIQLLWKYSLHLFSLIQSFVFFFCFSFFSWFFLSISFSHFFFFFYHFLCSFFFTFGLCLIFALKIFDIW